MDPKDIVEGATKLATDAQAMAAKAALLAQQATQLSVQTGDHGSTNAVSSVIIVGALIATSTEGMAAKVLGFLGVMLASVNIFGGFIVTQRMLSMFKKKQK